MAGPGENIKQRVLLWIGAKPKALRHRAIRQGRMEQHTSQHGKSAQIVQIIKAAWTLLHQRRSITRMVFCRRCFTPAVKKPVLQKAVRLQSELLRSGKFVGNLKEDKFLSPLRQRFSIPGGTCYFDVPQLHYWFNLPLEQRQQMASGWCHEFGLLLEAISFVLGFSREKGHFTAVVADNGFYQSNTDQHELLRIRYPIDAGVYPTVSGNKYRYAIRFMQLCDDAGRSNSDQSISFELACC